ncbi:MAG TPA: glycosyltransferase family 4 protein [Chthoniobacteraceae bacterium]|nr:glycosyltransferase family 4 protein [Chthoniobacteraceae bacterium]
MKILFSSHRFPPDIGGIEEVGSLLAREFTRRGHEVIVVTQSRGEALLDYEVRRRPKLPELAGLTRWSDVVFHNNLSLRTAWPLIGIRKPWVVAHHTWIARMDGRRAPADRLKLRVIHAARNIAVSRAIAAALGVPARVIANPYRDDLFRQTNQGARGGEVIFLGRLVSDKGADLLLEALAMAGARATIVGDGPERASLEARARELGLDAHFAGALRGEELVAALNHHKLLAVPSCWEEPFGIVALEAMACGCVPVVAQSGGLPGAVGDAGVIFEKGNANALADALRQLLADDARLSDLRAKAGAQLARHRPAVIASQYLEVLEEAAR